MKKNIFIICLAILVISLVNTTYAESIGGIHLGMTRNEVVAKYGEPAWIYGTDQGFYYAGGEFDKFEVYKNGLAVYYGGAYERKTREIVRIVAMFNINGNNRKFDNSNLGLNDSLESYKKAYSIVSMGRARNAFKRESYKFYTDEKNQYLYLEISPFGGFSAAMLSI